MPGMPADPGAAAGPSLRPRLPAIDLARTAALLGMAVFHFSYDLELTGWLAPGTVVTGFFWYFARLIAGSFIFLAGLGLWLAHGQGIRWRAFLRRLARIGAAAGLVTLATHFALPGMTVFYGILHSIAVSSLIGLAFLRLRATAVLGVAAAVFALPWLWAHPFFGGALVWTGLSGTVPMTADFEPLFPWFAPFLAGIAAGRVLSRFGLWPCLDIGGGRVLRALAWPGRHSLAIYLVHQPVLLAVVIAFTRLHATLSP